MEKEPHTATWTWLDLVYIAMILASFLGIIYMLVR